MMQHDLNAGLPGSSADAAFLPNFSDTNGRRRILAEGMHQPYERPRGLSDKLVAVSRSFLTYLQHFDVGSGFKTSDDFCRKLIGINYCFHSEVLQIYSRPEICELIPGLQGPARFAAIERDAERMNIEASEYLVKPVSKNISLHEALGWLFVAESSTLITAWLHRIIGGLRFVNSSGPSYLATAPDQFLRSWRNFTATLDTIVITQSEEAKAVNGAQDALMRASFLTRSYLGSDPKVR
ncbi:MAG: biliverdin-producing heme oxygenase [Pseudomonadota bacterium]